MCTVGSLGSAALALPVPLPETLGNYEQDFIIKQYWRVIWGVPIVCGLLQIFLLTVIFRYDTPVQLKKDGNWEDLTYVMSKIYKPN